MDKKTNKGYAEGGYVSKDIITEVMGVLYKPHNFAFMSPREKIDMSKVTLEGSEGPSWHGTIEELNKLMSKKC